MAELNTKYFSTRQEKMVANELGGHPIGGSGSRPCSPGDVRTWDWLVECKTHTTPNHSIYFNRKVWDKICEEAMAIHRKPVLIVDDGSQSISRTWCLCRKHNLNVDNASFVQFPSSSKDNLSAKHDLLIKLTKAQTSGNIVLFCTKWKNDDVIVAPLNIFKEYFER